MSTFSFNQIDYPNLIKYSINEDFFQHIKSPKWLFLLFKAIYNNYDDLSQNDKMYLGYQYISILNNDNIEQYFDIIKKIFNVNIILLKSDGSIFMNNDQKYPYVILYFDQIYYLIGVEKKIIFHYQHPIVDILSCLSSNDKNT